MAQINKTTVAATIGGKEMRISTGELAKQAGGSVVVQYGETMVLGTATMGKPMSPDADFLPLLVEYEEKFYAGGKIKGSRFMKREGRPHDDAILTARLIDRSVRPLFPKGMINDVQLVLTVLSYDGENDSDVLAMIAGCGALMISDIPWDGKLGAARVGLIDGAYVINPTTKDREGSKLDLLLAGTASDIAMIESGAMEVTEHAMLDAIEAGQKGIASVVTLLEDLQAKVGKKKKEAIYAQKNEEHTAKVEQLSESLLREKLQVSKGKDEIGQAERDVVAHVLENMTEEEKEEIAEKKVRHIIHELHGKVTRKRVLEESSRSDGRALDEIRAISVQAGVLPRTHGTGLFQRGDTQVLTVLTLGGPDDELIVDTMQKEEKKRYIHYYNFPAFSVGEIRPNRGPGRREIGHGALAERALYAVLPDRETWPYTMMLVSEVLESHGSSSMASVCGSSLALMDAGVPIKKAVAGIAMGLMSDGSGVYKVLTDIAGMEDEKGDMDFKVAGTKDGITALQMDIKVTGLTRNILAEALEQAKKARLHILGKMEEVLAAPRPQLSKYAPRIHIMRVAVEKIGSLIGPKGKHINEIIAETGVDISIEDDGLVSITSNDPEAMEKAKEWVYSMSREIKVGERFNGKVVKLMDFGAFVQLVPNVDGLVHISQFRDERVNKIDEVVKVGDILPVIVTEIDSNGRISLSHKAAK
ncbi:MAG TPA: polyribonucleotide nucleotidyltransferase [Candidatus Andersenbacteria bacterium]|nr:polyribonucleotide nucleotidyltransferase [Candidatus Andersenbacteria bacterium]